MAETNWYVVHTYSGYENAVKDDIEATIRSRNLQEQITEVLVPTLTFIAAVNPVTYLEASPIFIDCDDSLCIDPIKLEKFSLILFFIKEKRKIT